MKKINLMKFTSIIIAISALLFLYAPFQSDSTLGNDSGRELFKVIIYGLSGVSFGISVLSFIKEKRKITKSILLYITSLLVYYSLLIFHSYNSSINLSGILILIICLGYCLIPDDYQLQSYKLFKKIWTIICLLSIICYLSYSLDLFIPYTTKSYYSLLYGLGDSYIDYGLVFLYKSGDYLRLCGICNEAGFFGTLCALILCADGINLKKKSNIIILVAGLFTFSFAFFLILFVYLLFKSWKNWKIFILIIITFILVIFVIPNIQTDNNDINYLVARFTITDSGFAGDNRSNKSLDYVYDNALHEKPIFGYGNGYIHEVTSIEGVSSYKTYIIEFGIVGCILIWGFLLLSSIFKTKNGIDSIGFITAFFISIYQRPNIISLPYMFILFGSLVYIYEKNKKSNVKN